MIDIQGKGIATILLKEIERDAMTTGIERIRMAKVLID
ncbi:GNAT family N-acetyltransferase [Parabacteroides pacaensis]